MIPANGSRKVYLACGFTDMRKQINGLAALVQYQFELDPFSTALFVFCNRKREKLKILQWDQAGFWLHYRRLEKGKFQWPEKVTKPGAVCISQRELNWLLDGLSLYQRNAHPAVTANLVV